MQYSYKCFGLSLLLFLVAITVSLGQTTVTGKVTDAVSGEPLSGVNVIVKNRVVGTITDSQGEFTLEVSDAPPFSLLVSFIGYGTQEISITSSTTTSLDIKMREETVLGQQIVVSASRVEENILRSPVTDRKSVV